MKDLTDAQLLRYSRQIMLPDVDIDGQQQLLNARVLIVGLGGLGAPVASYLAAAGVGELVLVDDDVVESSNLQRQIIHSEKYLGMSKVESAAAAIAALNPEVVTRARQTRVNAQNLPALLVGIDAVVDCSDNFSTRFALNAACVAARVPLISGAAIRMEGQVAVFDSRDPHGPCYRCLYDAQDDEHLSCAASGVLAPLVGVIGSLQALETVKVLVGTGTPLTGRLQLFDARHGQWQEIRLARDPECPVCSARS